MKIGKCAEMVLFPVFCCGRRKISKTHKFGDEMERFFLENIL
jgi:hypothetical protein